MLRTATTAGDTTNASARAAKAARAARTFADGVGVRRDRSAEVGVAALSVALPSKQPRSPPFAAGASLTTAAAAAEMGGVTAFGFGRRCLGG